MKMLYSLLVIILATLPTASRAAASDGVCQYSHVYATTCATYTTSTACNANNLCGWYDPDDCQVKSDPDPWPAATSASNTDAGTKAYRALEDVCSTTHATRSSCDADNKCQWGEAIDSTTIICTANDEYFYKTQCKSSPTYSPTGGATPTPTYAPGDTLFNSAATISGTANGKLHHVHSQRTDGQVSSDVCVVSTIILSAPASGLTTGIIKVSDYDVWAVTSYPTLSQDVAALRAKFLTNSVCEGSAFADTSCTSAAVSLSAPNSYMLVMVNAEATAVTINSALVTVCTAAQLATLGTTPTPTPSSGASRRTRTFTFAALIAGALTLF